MNSQLTDQNSERGTIFTEFLLTVPFLVFVLAGIVDLGQTLNSYFMLNRIAYEACRYAASVPAFENGALGDPDGVPRPNQQKVKNRIDTMLSRFPDAIGKNYTVSIQRVKNTAIGATRDQVRVTIRTEFQSNFPGVALLFPTINTEVSGPYLFPK